MHRLPGQRAGLTKERILQTAFALFESDGLEAVSVRRVAAQLGVAPNALYAHIPDGETLRDGLLDHALQSVDIPTAGSLVEQLRRLMTAIFAALVRHPELSPLFFTRREIGPEAMRLGEATLQILAEIGLNRDQADQAMRALMIFAIGSAALNLPRTGGAESRLTNSSPGAIFEAGITWLLTGITARTHA